jgi:hypothetical protein
MVQDKAAFSFLFRRPLGLSVSDAASQPREPSVLLAPCRFSTWCGTAVETDEPAASLMTRTRTAHCPLSVVLCQASPPQPHHTCTPLVIVHHWFWPRREPAGQHYATTGHRSTRRLRPPHRRCHRRLGARHHIAVYREPPEGSCSCACCNWPKRRDEWPMPPGPMSRRWTAAVMTIERQLARGRGC